MRVCSDDFLSESMPCSRLWRAVEVFSWPRPMSIDGISGRCSVHPRLGGLAERPAPTDGIGRSAAGAMVGVSALSCDRHSKLDLWSVYVECR